MSIHLTFHPFQSSAFKSNDDLKVVGPRTKATLPRGCGGGFAGDAARGGGFACGAACGGGFACGAACGGGFGGGFAFTGVGACGANGGTVKFAPPAATAGTAMAGPLAASAGAGKAAASSESEFSYPRNAAGSNFWSCSKLAALLPSYLRSAPSNAGRSPLWLSTYGRNHFLQLSLQSPCTREAKLTFW